MTHNFTATKGGGRGEGLSCCAREILTGLIQPRAPGNQVSVCRDLLELATWLKFSALSVLSCYTCRFNRQHICIHQQAVNLWHWTLNPSIHWSVANINSSAQPTELNSTPFFFFTTSLTIHTVIHSFALPVNIFLKLDPHHVLGTLFVLLVRWILASFIFSNTCLNYLFGDFHLLTCSAILKSFKLSKQKSYFGHRGFCFATCYIWIEFVSSHWGAWGIFIPIRP